MVAQHKALSAMAYRIDTEYCPVCLLLFTNRGAVLEHLGKSALCYLNEQALPDLAISAVAEFTTADEDARAEAKTSGVHKNFVARPATRMLGPYRRVQKPDGSFTGTRNGHGLSENHPWRRARYFEVGGDGSNRRRQGPCHQISF